MSEDFEKKDPSAKEEPILVEREKVETDITQRRPLDLGKWRQKEPRGKIQVYDWLRDVSEPEDCGLVQVQFKNTRCGYYVNPQHLDLKQGDMVVVEGSPGHDVGQVTMTGKLVELQMRRHQGHGEKDLKQVYRKARPADLEKFAEARAREHDTMIRSRQIAEQLELKMKIGDVEYQGDGGKAIFYYIADERVDFRKLIRILADTFNVKIEMKQIGARQEAGRIGGIGPCGRPLCCATWMNRFVSVGTNAARVQDLSLNPQKLAGQCAKLKCCLNFEIDQYGEASKKLPGKEYHLETVDGTWYLFKTDILSGMLTYSTAKNMAANLVTIPAERAWEVIEMNKQGDKPEKLDMTDKKESRPKEFVEIVGQDELTRFDKLKKKKKKKKPQQGASQGQNAPQGQGNKQKPQRQQGNGNAEPKAQGGDQQRPQKQRHHGQKPRKPKKEGNPEAK